MSYSFWRPQPWRPALAPLPPSYATVLNTFMMTQTYCRRHHHHHHPYVQGCSYHRILVTVLLCPTPTLSTGQQKPYRPETIGGTPRRNDGTTVSSLPCIALNMPRSSQPAFSKTDGALSNQTFYNATYFHPRRRHHPRRRRYHPRRRRHHHKQCNRLP